MIRMIRALCLGLFMAATAVGQQHVTAEMVADTTAVTPGKTFTVALHLTVDDGWHVYWTNPGDAGAATTLKITALPGFTVGPVQYPVPEKLPQPGGLTVYAYEKELLLTAQITPPADLNGQTPVTLSANAGWCVCSDICILGKKKLEVSLPVAAGGRANADLFAAWAPRMPVSFDQACDKMEFSTSAGIQNISIHWRNAPPAGDLQWLPGPCDDLTVQSTGIRTTDGWTTIDLKIDPIQGISPTSSTISGVLAYYQPGKPAGGVAIILNRADLKTPAAK
jgi:DsbC/DsbD-like thiol-disulfide interchange protein